MPSTRKFWFRLIGTNGDSSTHPNAGSLVISVNTNVDELRDAVKDKNPLELPSVDACDLRVFKNKKAYSDGDKPMRASVMFYGFGSDAGNDNALVVLVPDSSYDIPTGDHDRSVSSLIAGSRGN